MPLRNLTTEEDGWSGSSGGAPAPASRFRATVTVEIDVLEARPERRVRRILRFLFELFRDARQGFADRRREPLRLERLQRCVEGAMQRVKDGVGRDEHRKIARVDRVVGASHAVLLLMIDAHDAALAEDATLLEGELELALERRRSI